MINMFLELKDRGLIKDSSGEKELTELFKKRQTVYCGFDPSAKSMHVGNFLLISMLMRLQRAGHRIIAVVGGGTGMIGDPSGKLTERRFLSSADVEENTNAVRKQLEKFINFEDPEKGLIVNNYDWLSKMSLLDYLREAGRYFQIGYLLGKEVISSRLETGISYSEFSYTVIQGYDFKYLYDKYECKVQIGGSDQWGNLTSGMDLIRKSSEGKDSAEVFVAPLILRSDGKKFGKSEDGALFLDPNLTSPFRLYQYFINVPDADAIHYLKVFTFLSLKEVEEIEAKHLEAPHLRLAQTVLAKEMVKEIHGEEDMNDSVLTTEALFQNRVLSLSEKQLAPLFKDPSFKLTEPTNVLDFLVSIEAATSKREAREFVTGNSISINEEKVTDVNFVVDKNTTIENKYILVRRGKKNIFFGIYGK